MTVLFGNGNTNPFRAIGTLSNDSVEGNNGAGTVPATMALDLFIQRAGDPALSSFLGAAVVAIPNTVNNPSLNNNVAFVTRGGNMCAPNQWLGF